MFNISKNRNSSYLFQYVVEINHNTACGAGGMGHGLDMPFLTLARNLCKY